MARVGTLGHIDADPHVRAFLGPLGEPLDGRQQSELIERDRASIERESIDLGKHVAQGDDQSLRRAALLGFVQRPPHDRDEVGMELDGDARSLDAGSTPGPLAARCDLVDEDARGVRGKVDRAEEAARRRRSVGEAGSRSSPGGSKVTDDPQHDEPEDDREQGARHEDHVPERRGRE